MADSQPPLNTEYINSALSQFTFKNPKKSSQSQNSQDTKMNTEPQQSKNQKKSSTKKRKKEDPLPDTSIPDESHQLKQKRSNNLPEDPIATIEVNLPKRTTRSSTRNPPPSQSKSNESSSKAESLSNTKYKVMEIDEDTDWNAFDEKVTIYSTSPKRKVQKAPPKPAPKKPPPAKSQENNPPTGLDFNLEETKVPYETLKLPEWAKDSNIRDKYGKSPTDEDYDPTTLYIPPKGRNKMTVLISKYWEVKSQHFEKIVIVRQNNCYYAYHKDAFVLQEVCGARVYTQFTFALCGMFPHNVNDYCKKLIEKNYKIVLVEPKNQSGEDEDSSIDIYQIITKGTFVEPNPNYFITRYCLVLTLKDEFCGFTYVDTTTHQFYMGEFQDTPNRTQLRSLLLRVSPVEIVYREKTINKEILAMLKNLYWKPTLTILTTSQPTNLEVVIAKLKGAIKKEKKLVNKRKSAEIKMDSQSGVLESLLAITEDFIAEKSILKTKKSSARKDPYQDQENPEECPQFWTIQGIYLALEYMEYLHLEEIVFKKGTFMIDNVTEKHTHNLILDGQSVYNLELLDVSYINNRIGAKSLFGYMNHTKSPFGERMFRRWLLEPLTDIEKINQRLDAVEELILFKDLRDLIQQRLHKVPDIERLIHSIYNFGSNRKVVYNDYDIFVEPKIMMFVEAIKQLREIDNTMKAIQEYGGNVRSERLCALLNYENPKDKKGGLFPPINERLAEFEAMMVIYEDLPVPAPGKDKEFDRLMNEMEKIKKDFQTILQEVRKKLKYQDLSYVHVRQRYEIQVPDHLVGGNRKPKELIQTSSKKGFVRFHTVEIQKLVNRLEEIEKEMKTVILPYIINCFKIFYSHNSTWQKVIFCMSELDCLVSLTHLTTVMPMASRPKFVECCSEDTTQVFDLKGMVHPCVALNSTEFIKNDIVLEQDKRIFLITGPNMGGKSTLMRTVCIATIMAQIGSYVPADSFTLTPRDRIFTRIGASDNIFEGKSTFFVELEETLNIVNEATYQSLVIIDELGRGTSTYDGMAIAYAVLKHLTDNVKCMTMFATHFHLLLEEFKLFKSVEMYYMESEFEGDDIVTFLYKFTKGCISNSFGLSVARMAGLPENVIEKGREMAMSMTKEQKNLLKSKALLEKFTHAIDLLSLENHDVDHVLEKLAHTKESLHTGDDEIFLE